MHGDGAADDNLWGNIYHLTSVAEQFYTVSVSTNDISDETSRTLPNVKRFTSVGPVLYVADSLAGDDPYQQRIYISLQNNGSVGTATDIVASLSALDTCVTAIHNSVVIFGDIPAGESGVTMRSSTCPVFISIWIISSVPCEDT